MSPPTRVGRSRSLRGTVRVVSSSFPASKAVWPHGVLDGPFDVAVARDGASVYVTSGYSLETDKSDATLGKGIAVLARDRVTGRLTQPAGPAGCFTVGGNGGACDADSRLAGAEDAEVSFWSNAVSVFDRRQLPVVSLTPARLGGKALRESKPFAISATARPGDPASQVSCTARVRGRAILTKARYLLGVVTCSGVVPAKTAGSALTASLAAVVDGVRAAVSFSFSIAA